MTDDLTTRLLAAIERAEQEGAKRSCGVVHPQFDTNHPEGHPDEAVLRHCAAHRKIIERHLKVTENWGDLDGWHDVDLCDTCAYGRSCSHCFDREDLPFVVWPCPTLRDLAEAYDLTTEPAP